MLVLYIAVLAASYYSGRNMLPERLMERGLYLQLMNYTSLLARAFGKRDWVEHAAIDVYNTLAERRGRKVGKGELLVLIPRCLSKQALDGVLEIAGRWDVLCARLAASSLAGSSASAARAPSWPWPASAT
jgi:hypothetical protein